MIQTLLSFILALFNWIARIAGILTRSGYFWTIAVASVVVLALTGSLMNVIGWAEGTGWLGAGIAAILLLAFLHG